MSIVGVERSAVRSVVVTMGDKLGGTELFWEDAVVIAFYFVMVLGVGAWVCYVFFIVSIKCCKIAC